MRARLVLAALAAFLVWGVGEEGQAADKQKSAASTVAAAPTPPAAPTAPRQPSVWTVLDPHEFTAANGATLTKQSDKSILASGKNETPETYTIQAHVPLKEITAIRLEVLTDATLPQSGPGRAPNGNFVLSAFQVKAAAKKEPGKSQPLIFSKATADFSQAGFSADSLVGGKGAQGGGWAIAQQMGKAHAAVFELKSPIGQGDGTTLAFTLTQSLPAGKHNVGRFRLSVTDSKPPFPLDVPQ